MLKRLTAMVASTILAITTASSPANIIVSAPILADAVIVNQANANTNFANGQLSIYHVGTNDQRSLLKFDLSSIPVGTTIVSATLTLHTGGNGGAGANVPIEVYRLTKSWVETDVTFISADSATLWSGSGGDYVGSNGATNGPPYALASTNASPTPSVPITWDVTYLVSQWVNNIVPNYGLLVRAGLGNQLTFYSEETALNAGLQPSLLVDVPEPVSGSVMALSGVLLLRRRAVIMDRQSGSTDTI